MGDVIKLCILFMMVYIMTLGKCDTAGEEIHHSVHSLLMAAQSKSSHLPN